MYLQCYNKTKAIYKYVYICITNGCQTRDLKGEKERERERERERVVILYNRPCPIRHAFEWETHACTIEHSVRFFERWRLFVIRKFEMKILQMTVDDRDRIKLIKFDGERIFKKYEKLSLQQVLELGRLY